LLQLRLRSTLKSPDRKGGLICHGYQGVDIISSRIPLSRWNGLDRDELASLVAAHEAWSDYDDFVIDTSGMSPRAVLACCRLSHLVLLVVTPAPGSQAGAFALLRILRLNGFDNPVLLVVNQVEEVAQAGAIHARFSDKARQHLGLKVPLLAAVVRDEQVRAAARLRQTFTSLYPESPASAARETGRGPAGGARPPRRFIQGCPVSGKLWPRRCGYPCVCPVTRTSRITSRRRN
jgi:MinD-like ATPase involved in chromosome partitioning or flagellar assembly